MRIVSKSKRIQHEPGIRGFSLIELLIVVAVIAIIAAMAVPNLVNSKKAANEAAAIVYMKAWVAAQELYKMKYGHYADADNQLVTEELIGVDPPDRLGYVFSIDNAPQAINRWWGRGWPRQQGVTGERQFYIDATGVIRYSLSGPAGPTSPALGSSP